MVDGALVVSPCTPLSGHMPKTQSRDCATINSPLSKALQLQATCLDLAAAHRNPEDVGSNSSCQLDYRIALDTAFSKASACGYPPCTRAMRACYIRKGENDSGATPVLSLTSAVTQAVVSATARLGYRSGVCVFRSVVNAATEIFAQESKLPYHKS